MSSVNTVVLIGRLGKEPELRKTNNNISVMTVSLAVTRTRQKEETDWITVNLWRQNADFIAQYAHKGDLISVTGEIQTRNYERDGQKVYITEVQASEVTILGHSERGQRKDDKTPAGHKSGAQDQNNTPETDYLAGIGLNITEDDLPF